MPAVRPPNFDAFRGQKAATDHLKVSVKAALRLKRPHGHTLFLGPPGLGKTTLGASVLPAEMGTTAKIVNCSSIERPQDLLPTLSTTPAGTILFLDEIHALIRPLVETLYQVMEDSKLSIIIIGEGDSRQTLTVDLSPFTIIGATTREGLLPEPLRDRFKHTIRLDLYTDLEMAEVLRWVGESQGVHTWAEGALDALIPACHGTARHAVSLVEACIETIAGSDVLSGRNMDDRGLVVDQEIVGLMLARLRISRAGLTYPEQRLLACLADATQGTVGLSTLASVIDEETTTIEEIYEPWLLRTGLIEKTPKGRRITAKGRRALKETKRGRTTH